MYAMNDSNGKEMPVEITREWVTQKAPFRPIDGHKGTFGSLLLWAGSVDMAGAAYLSANAVCRSGTGIIHILSGQDVAAKLFPLLPQAIYHQVQQEKGLYVRAHEALQHASACVVGPGLVLSGETDTQVLLYLLANAKQILLDAGALTFLSEAKNVFKDAFANRVSAGLMPAVITPHPGEFARLLPTWNKDDREVEVRAFSKEWRVVLVLKGNKTVVSSPDGEWYINSTGNDGLAKGGSGDVLAGLIGSFLAQGLSPTLAANAGVYFHGLAGDLASRKLGKRYMQPTDLFGYFTEAFRTCKWEEG